MKASELRINNLVDDNGLVETVISDHLINDEYYDGLKGCLPIPLTEEWLIKFGFEKIEYGEEYGYGVEYVLYNSGAGGFILEYADDFSISIMGDKNDLGVTPDIKLFKYVHQLQNLYHALTGNELEIKK